MNENNGQQQQQGQPAPQAQGAPTGAGEVGQAYQQPPQPYVQPTPPQPYQQPQAPQQPPVQQVRYSQPVQASYNVPAPGTQPSAGLEERIAQLEAEKQALTQQNVALNAQIAGMVSAGSQFTQPQAAPQQPQPQQAQPRMTQAQQLSKMGMQGQYENSFNPYPLSSLPDLSLEGLAGEIGKKE